MPSFLTPRLPPLSRFPPRRGRPSLSLSLSLRAPASHPFPPMACHHSNRHLHSPHQPCCGGCCCCASSCCTSAPHPAIPSTSTAAATDPLLRAIAAHLLQSPPPPAPQPAGYHFLNQQYSKPHYSHHQSQQHQQQKHHHPPPPPLQAQSLIQSLLRRIAALESALPHMSSPPPPPATAPEPPPQPSPPTPPRASRASIRDLAARTIQAHFRLYLVRRSQTLRHLKHLASVRSHVAAIKSSLSDEARLSPRVLTQKATDLLLQLDSIQSTDSMIREGKRSISRELVRLLEFADEVSAKRHQLFMESMETSHEGIDPAAFAEKSIPVIEELAGVPANYSEDDEGSDAGSPNTHASTSRAAKRVTFAKDGKVPRVSPAAAVPFAEEDMQGWASLAQFSDDHWGQIAKEMGGREDGGGGGSRHPSNDERSPIGRQKAGIRPAANGPASGQKLAHSPGLSAPLPVHMEPRRVDPKKKKNVMVV